MLSHSQKLSKHGRAYGQIQRGLLMHVHVELAQTIYAKYGTVNDTEFCACHLWTIIVMAGNWRHIPRSTKEHMVILSSYMKSCKIVQVCDVSHRTVN